MTEPITLLWLDIETTGINPQQDHILEIGMQATDLQGQLVADDFHVTITPTVWNVRRFFEPQITGMTFEPRVPDMHVKNNLLIETYYTHATNPRKARHRATAYVRSLAQLGPKIVLAGNSVDFDRRFLNTWDSKILEPTSHQILDLTSLLICAQAVALQASATIEIEKIPTDHRTSTCLRNARKTYLHLLKKLGLDVHMNDFTPDILDNIQTDLESVLARVHGLLSLYTTPTMKENL